MPRYFFATRVGEDLLPDPDGRVLRDPDEAWEVAVLTFCGSVDPADFTACSMILTVS
jgi:hypothetical protein